MVRYGRSYSHLYCRFHTLRTGSQLAENQLSELSLLLPVGSFGHFLFDTMMLSASATTNRSKFAIKKSYSVENGYPARRRSLVDDAKFETQVNKEVKETWLENQRRSLVNEDELSEEEVFLTEPDDVDDNAPHVITLVLSLKESIGSMARVLKTIENCRGIINHIETRQSTKKGIQFEVLIRFEMTRDCLLSLMKALRQSASLAEAVVINERLRGIKDPWFPRHISELDLCNHLMTKYEPDLDMDHPGFADKVYRARRKKIADIAFEYKQ